MIKKSKDILSNSELEGDSINQIHYKRPDYLVVHSKDNCIRTIEIQNNKTDAPIISR